MPPWTNEDTEGSVVESSDEYADEDADTSSEGSEEDASESELGDDSPPPSRPRRTGPSKAQSANSRAKESETDPVDSEEEEEDMEDDAESEDEDAKVETPRFCCDSCGTAILTVRHHCLVCHDFDLCDECAARVEPCGAHLPSHPTCSVPVDEAAPSAALRPNEMVEVHPGVRRVSVWNSATPAYITALWRALLALGWNWERIRRELEPEPTAGPVDPETLFEAVCAALEEDADEGDGREEIVAEMASSKTNSHGLRRRKCSARIGVPDAEVRFDYDERESCGLQEDGLSIPSDFVSFHPRKPMLTETSKFVGVAPLANGMWRAKVMAQGRSAFVGDFSSELRAAIYHDAAVRALSKKDEQDGDEARGKESNAALRTNFGPDHPQVRAVLSSVPLELLVHEHESESPSGPLELGIYGYATAFDGSDAPRKETDSQLMARDAYFLSVMWCEREMRGVRRWDERQDNYARQRAWALWRALLREVYHAADPEEPDPDEPTHPESQAVEPHDRVALTDHDRAGGDDGDGEGEGEGEGEEEEEEEEKLHDEMAPAVVQHVPEARPQKRSTLRGIMERHLSSLVDDNTAPLELRRERLRWTAGSRSAVGQLQLQGETFGGLSIDVAALIPLARLLMQRRKASPSTMAQRLGVRPGDFQRWLDCEPLPPQLFHQITNRVREWLTRERATQRAVTKRFPRLPFYGSAGHKRAQKRTATRVRRHASRGRGHARSRSSGGRGRGSSRRASSPRPAAPTTPAVVETRAGAFQWRSATYQNELQEVTHTDAEETDRCTVCGRDGENSMPLHRCRACGAAVHERCYAGRDKLPDEWTCSACDTAAPPLVPRVSGPSREWLATHGVQWFPSDACQVCARHADGLACKRTTCGGMVHAVCSCVAPHIRWLDRSSMVGPDVSVFHYVRSLPSGVEGGVSGPGKCSVCGQYDGFKLKCANYQDPKHPGCGILLHPSCALRHGLLRVTDWGSNDWDRDAAADAPHPEDPTVYNFSGMEKWATRDATVQTRPTQCVAVASLKLSTSLRHPPPLFLYRTTCNIHHLAMSDKNRIYVGPEAGTCCGRLVPRWWRGVPGVVVINPKSPLVINGCTAPKLSSGVSRAQLRAEAGISSQWDWPEEKGGGDEGGGDEGGGHEEGGEEEEVKKADEETETKTESPVAGTPKLVCAPAPTPAPLSLPIRACRPAKEALRDVGSQKQRHPTGKRKVVRALFANDDHQNVPVASPEREQATRRGDQKSRPLETRPALREKRGRAERGKEEHDDGDRSTPPEGTPSPKRRRAAAGQENRSRRPARPPRRPDPPATTAKQEAATSRRSRRGDGEFFMIF